jgi:hypothetical protein
MRNLNIQINEQGVNSPTVVVLRNTELTSSDVIDRIVAEPSNDYIGDNIRTIDEVFEVNISDSSFVQVIGYNFKTEVLKVTLASGDYRYPGIMAATFLSFVAAASKGEFFNKYLR